MKGRAVYNEQHRDIGVFLFQMYHGSVLGDGDAIIHRRFGLVYKLKWVQGSRGFALDEGHDKFFKVLQ